MLQHARRQAFEPELRGTTWWQNAYTTQSGKPVPVVAERVPITQDAHALGRLGTAHTAWMIQINFWWDGPRHSVVAYIKECRECQMMHTKFNELVELHPLVYRACITK